MLASLLYIALLRVLQLVALCSRSQDFKELKQPLTALDPLLISVNGHERASERPARQCRPAKAR